MKIILLCLLLLLTGCSTSSRPYDGSLARTANSVGYVISNTSSGSGVLIAPDKVLTARHVCPLFFTSDMIFVHRDYAYCVKDIEYPVDNVDLAILTLEQACLAATPATISQDITDTIVVNIAYNNTCLRLFTNDILGFCDYVDATETHEMYYCRDFNTVLDDVPLFGNSGGAVFQYQNNSYQLIGIITATQLYSIPAYGRFVPLFPYYDSLGITR